MKHIANQENDAEWSIQMVSNQKQSQSRGSVVQKYEVMPEDAKSTVKTTGRMNNAALLQLAILRHVKRLRDAGQAHRSSPWVRDGLGHPAMPGTARCLW